MCLMRPLNPNPFVRFSSQFGDTMGFERISALLQDALFVKDPDADIRFQIVGVVVANSFSVIPSLCAVSCGGFWDSSRLEIALA